MRFWTIFLFSLTEATFPRLSFLEGSSIGISWQSGRESTCSEVHYGKDKDLNLTVDSGKHCDVYKGDRFHHVTLNDLEYATRYYYRIGCDATIYSFQTAARPGSHEPFTFAVYADLGPLHGEATLARLNEMRDDLVGHIFAGDIGYADDAFINGESYISRTNEFLRDIAPSSAYLPVMVAPGNHEAEDHTPVCLLSPACREGFGNFTAFNCVWNMPGGKGHSMWSSFDYGPIHFVLTNTETDYDGAPLEPYGEAGFIPTGKFGTPGEYVNWLRKDLEKAEGNRKNQPWIIVVGHRPISVMEGTVDPFVTPLSDEIIDLINKHADVYVAGHVHYYTSTVPKNSNKPILISIGGAGCDEWPERVVQSTLFATSDEANSFAYGDEQTFALLKFDNELVFEIAKSSTGELLDRIVIPKRQIQVHQPVVLSS